MNTNGLSGALAGLAQVLVPAAITYAATKGWFGDASSVPAISAAILTLLSAGWSSVTTKVLKGN